MPVGLQIKWLRVEGDEGGREIREMRGGKKKNLPGGTHPPAGQSLRWGVVPRRERKGLTA